MALNEPHAQEVAVAEEAAKTPVVGRVIVRAKIEPQHRVAKVSSFKLAKRQAEKQVAKKRGRSKLLKIK